MKAKKSFFISIMVVASFTGCSNPSITDSEKITTFIQPIVSDTLLVQSPKDFSYEPLSEWQAKVWNDTSHLIIPGHNDNFLQILMLDEYSYQYQPIINIPKYGPNGFKTNKPNFYWHNADSIFVFPTSMNKVFLYNANAQLVKTFAFEADLFYSFSSNNEQQGTVLHDGLLYVPTVPYANPKNIDFTSKTHVAYTLDLNNENFQAFSSYPDHLKNKIIPTSFLGSQIVEAFDSLLLFNNLHSDAIEYYNRQKNTYGNFSAGMTGYKHIKFTDQPIHGMSQQNLELQVKYPMYDAMLYDPFQELVYRFASHLNPNYENLSGSEILNRLETPNISYNTLVVMDAQLQKKFYQLPFDVDFAFPSRDGLIVRAAYMESGDNDVYLKLQLPEQ